MTTIFAGGSRGDSDGIGTGAAFQWLDDIGIDAIGRLATIEYDINSIATSFALSTSAKQKLRQITTVSVLPVPIAVVTTVATGITPGPERNVSGDLTFKPGFFTTATTVGDGPAGYWLIGSFCQVQFYSDLSDLAYLALPSRGPSNLNYSEVWSTVNKVTGAVVEVFRDDILIGGGGSFGPATPVSVVRHPSGSIYGFTNDPAKCRVFNSTGVFVGTVDLTSAIGASKVVLGASIASGASDVFVTATEYGASATSELHSIAGGPSGAGTLVFSKPRTAPGYEVMQRIAVTATKVFSVQPTAEGDTTVSNVWRLDRTTVTEELIAGLGPDANSLAAGIVTDGLFLYVAIASKPGGAGEFDDKAIVYRIPVDQRPQGWTVGSITMTNPRLP